MIQVHPATHDLDELVKRTASDRATALVGRQVARQDFRGPGDEGAEISAADEVGGLVNDLGRVALEVRGAARRKFTAGTGGMAVVAAAGRVNEVAAEPGPTSAGSLRRKFRGTGAISNPRRILVASLSCGVSSAAAGAAWIIQSGAAHGLRPSADYTLARFTQCCVD